MTDPFDIYNNTAVSIICANGTIPASSYISISSTDAQAWARDPIVISNLWETNIGVSVYGNDLSSGFDSQADIWMSKIAGGILVY